MSEKRGPGRRPSPTPPGPRVCYEFMETSLGWNRVRARHYQWDRKAGNNKNKKYRTIGYLPPGCKDITQLVDKDVFKQIVRDARKQQKQAAQEKLAQEAAEREKAEQEEAKKEADEVVSLRNSPIPFSDTRDPEKVVYPAYIVLFVLMMCAGLGFVSTRQIAEFWRAYREDLERVFKDFPQQDISHDTIRNFYIALGKCDSTLLLEQFNAMLLLEEGVREDILRHSSPEEKKAFLRTVLALDGQAVRASKLSVGKTSAKCCLSVYDTTYSIVHAQELVGEKTNEIPHARSLLRRIDIRGSIITADALHTQVELLMCIIEGGADYCMAVKGNQPTTYETICKAFNAPENEHLVKTLTRDDKGHGRSEKRVIRVLPGSVLEPEIIEKWPGLANGSIAQVVSTRLELSTSKKSVDTRYFISSLSYEVDWIAPWLLYIIRRHWCIENKLHWVLDVTYGQDAIQCKNNDFLRGVTTVNKFNYNFASVLQMLLSRERGEKVSMRSLKPYFGSVSSMLKHIGMVCGGTGGENLEQIANNL